MSAPGQRRSYLPRAAFGRPQQAPESIGAKRDAYGNLIPTGPQASTQAPPNDGSLSAQHDWSAFDSAFHKTALNKPGGPIGPMTPAQSAADWAELPMGASRVIPDEGITPQKTASGVPQGGPVAIRSAAGDAAISIDPKYRTAGADSTGRLQPAAGSGRGGLTQEQGKALIAAYPNLGIQGHADNLAFQKAYMASMDPSKPMSNDDVLGIAHRLFAPKSAIGQVGGDKFGTAPGSPGYQTPINTGDFTAQSIQGAQAPVNFAGTDAGAAPWHQIEGAPSTAAGRAGATVAASVGGAANATGSALGSVKDFGQDVGRTIANNTVIPAFNFTSGLVGSSKQVQPLPYAPAQNGTGPTSADKLGTRTAQETADWTPKGADVTTPISFPKFSPSGAPSTQASSIAGFGQPSNGQKDPALNFYSSL